MLFRSTLPAGVSFVNATLNGNPAVPTSVLGQQYTFTVNSSDTATAGLVSGGESGTLVVNVTVDNPLASGITSLVNTATLDSDQTTVIEDSVTVPVTVPELSISKSASASLLIPGDTVIYTITVLNTGSVTATNVTVDDDIPDQTYFEYVAASIAGEIGRASCRERV